MLNFLRDLVVFNCEFFNIYRSKDYYMAVKIRLSRIGKKKAPFYRIVAVDSRKKRDGASLENLGTYDGLKGVIVQLDLERVNYWVSKGAILSDTIKKLLKMKSKSESQKPDEEKNKTKVKKETAGAKSKAKAKEEVKETSVVTRAIADKLADKKEEVKKQKKKPN